MEWIPSTIFLLDRIFSRFQGESISESKKQVRLSSEIYHVGGGAQDAYTGYKQGILKDFHFVQLGETTLAGAAKLAMAALKQND